MQMDDKEIKSLQQRLGEWRSKVFPNATRESIMKHLQEEIAEFKEAHDPEEAADCALLLMHHAYKCGYDLLEEMEKKFEKIQKRTYEYNPKLGYSKHVNKNRKTPV